jgi:DNA-binding response OmpR family regulator
MKVLVAEDDRDFGNILTQYISISGFDVKLGRDGKEAWELFSQDKPDICVFDVMMPEMDGFTLAEKVKEVHPDVPVIFLTAKSLKEDIVRGLKIGADDYITKPFDSKQLIKAVETRLARKEIFEARTNDLKRTISYALPHELQTPLAAIMGFTHILIEDYNQIERGKILEIA